MHETSLLRQEPNQRRLGAGEVLFEVGDHATHMYAVIEGEIEIVDGERVVETVGPDEIFGEMAILDRRHAHPRSATARASADTLLAEVDQERFLRLVKLNPLFALTVMNRLADRLRRGW